MEPTRLNLGTREVLLDKYCSDCKTIIDAAARAKRMAEMEEALKERRRRRAYDLWEQANLGPRFARSTFQTWEVREGTERAYKTAKDYVAEWLLDEGLGLILVGPAGCGKSHIAAAVVQALMDKGSLCIFQSVPDLLKKIRATYGNEGNEGADMVKALEDCDLLVLDDLGSERWTAWAEEQIYTLIDHRYRNEKPIVVTTNLKLNKLEQVLGTRIMDRLVEMCRAVSMDCTSYRKKRAELRKLGIGGEKPCASSI